MITLSRGGSRDIDVSNGLRFGRSPGTCIERDAGEDEEQRSEDYSSFVLSCSSEGSIASANHARVWM